MKIEKKKLKKKNENDSHLGIYLLLIITPVHKTTKLTHQPPLPFHNESEFPSIKTVVILHAIQAYHNWWGANKVTTNTEISQQREKSHSRPLPISIGLGGPISKTY